MIRKLHNSLLALSATTLALAACLVATGTGMAPADLPAANAMAAASLPAAPYQVQVLDAEYQAGVATARPAPPPRKGPSRRNRQTLAMPFFSFATRS